MKLDIGLQQNNSSIQMHIFYCLINFNIFPPSGLNNFQRTSFEPFGKMLRLLEIWIFDYTRSSALFHFEAYITQET